MARVKKVLIVIVAILLVFCVTFGIYVSNYYKAEPEALAVLEENTSVTEEDGYYLLRPEESAETGIIFYPGAKVDERAYLPILEQLREKGMLCILVKMPFHMAIFDQNAAEAYYGKYPEIKEWYISGHSMGGAMASSYASSHPEKVKGVILLGAYLYGDYPAKKALTIYGSLNTSVAEKVDATENVVVIEGGNHAQFGNYGKQKGDADALITSEDQQNQAVEAIEEFVNR